MVTTGGIAVGLDLNDEDKSKSLYTDKITGINPTAEINPYVSNTKFAVTAFNPDVLQPSGSYCEPEEIIWLRNRNNVTMQEKKELQLEIKVYKKIIKNLLKKK